jgi:hypothetical protein
VVAPNTSAEALEPLDPDVIAAEIARWKRIVLARRQLKEIKRLKAEYRGEEVNEPIEVLGSTLPQSKRPASNRLYRDHPKYLRIAHRKKFTGASLGELQEYLNE